MCKYPLLVSERVDGALTSFIIQTFMYKRSSPALASSHASPALRCIPRQAEIICLAYNETAKDGITRHRLGLQVSPLRVLLSLSTLAYPQPDTSSTTFAMNALLLSHDQARTLSYRYALSRSYASHRIASHRTNKDPRIPSPHNIRFRCIYTHFTSIVTHPFS